MLLSATTLIGFSVGHKLGIAQSEYLGPPHLDKFVLSLDYKMFNFFLIIS